MVQPQQTHRPPLRPVLEAYVNITAATYTAKAGDRVIGVNRAGTATITLPTAEVRKGRIYTVKDESGAANSNNITVDTEGSETIDGSATDTINVNYESKSYYSDGANWFILPVTPDTNTQLSLATTVSTQAHGDSAAAGSASDASKGDHKHGMPAAGGVSQATQAALEAETDEDSYIAPDLAHFGPWAAKAWVYWEQSGTHSILASYNMTSVTDGGGAGDTDHLWDTDFSSIDYTVVGGGEWDGTPPDVVGNHLTTGITTKNGDSNHVAADFNRLSLAAFGDQ